MFLSPLRDLLSAPFPAPCCGPELSCIRLPLRGVVQFQLSNGELADLPGAGEKGDTRLPEGFKSPLVMLMTPLPIDC